MPSYLHWNQALPKGQQVPKQTCHSNSPATQEHSPELQYTGSSKLFQNLWSLITHYLSLHSREKKPSSTHQNSNTSLPNQETLTSHWYTTLPTVRKLHKKENSTNSQNMERPHQTQQYNQDKEAEEYPAGKGTGELPTKPNKRGSRESTWEGIPNIDSENDPKSWNQNGITDK